MKPVKPALDEHEDSGVLFNFRPQSEASSKPTNHFYFIPKPECGARHDTGSPGPFPPAESYYLH